MLNPPVVLVWHPPPSTAIKLNVDGAISKANGKVGIGVVARDSAGQVIDFLSSPTTGFLSPRVTEALAFREALIFAANNGLTDIIVEGDALQIVQAINKGGDQFSDCSSIISDCLELLPLFSTYSFQHVKRSCNRVAHSLAKKSLSCARLESWGGVLSLFGLQTLPLVIYGPQTVFLLNNKIPSFSGENNNNNNLQLGNVV